MSKKIIIGMFLCVLIIGQLTMVTNAVGQSSDLTFYVNYPEPFCSDTMGYMVLVYQHSANDYRMNTLFWSMEPEVNEVYGSDFTNVMDINVNGSTVSLSPYVVGGSYWYNLYEFSSSDTVSRLHSGYHNAIQSTPTWSYNYGNLVAVLFNGNVGAVNLGGRDLQTPVVHWTNTPDSNEIYNYMWRILYSLQFVEEDTGLILDKLNSILSENVSANQKLDDLKRLHEQLIAEQEESNSWLEKIFNYLKESPEQQRQEAQTQGNNSTSQGMNAIEDKGGDFANSLGGLTSSMNYSGTECAWEFPEVKIPAISGVMDEVVLIKRQPIDFSVWVNAIPSDILIVVQSLCTIGLIVFCFKELYGTIEYVLTLRKGGGSDE